MNMIVETRIRELIGQPLSAVAFVHDYVELHFDEKIVRAFTPPRVCIDVVVVTFPQDGSRDALCHLIGQIVVNVLVCEGAEIELQFDGDSSVQIPLGEKFKSGPEAAHFVSGENQPIEIW